MLTRGVWRATPRFFGIALAEATAPHAMRPCPPSFSLAKTNTVSPLAMCLPPYIVFCAANTNVLARRSRTSALIANAMLDDRNYQPHSHEADNQETHHPERPGQ